MFCLVPLVLEVVLQAVATGLPAARPQSAIPPAVAAVDVRRTWQCDFAFQDGALLRRGQQLGGRVWVPPSAGASAAPDVGGHAPRTLPVLVVLHGLNAAGHLHRLMRPDG